MLLVKSELFSALNTIAGVRGALQDAIKLEHSTIPAYLYALYSLKPGENQRIADLLTSIVQEEMLHMSLACNVLNAIGGTPLINTPEFIPTYPGLLPGIANGPAVGLQRFSKELVQKVFMDIEEPEDPLNFPVLAIAMAAEGPKTIGTFYRGIQTALRELNAQGNIFTGNPDRQVKFGWTPDEEIVVVDLDSALRAIDVIVLQGEGAPKSPLDLNKNIAHYYRYAEIYHGKSLIPNPNAPPNAPDDQKYIYGGAPIPFDESGVWPVIDNPKETSYPEKSKALYACDTFNYSYTSLLKALDITFNGQPDNLGTAIGLMESLRQQAIDMMSGIVLETGPNQGRNAGPSFEYQPTNP